MNTKIHQSMTVPILHVVLGALAAAMTAQAEPEVETGTEALHLSPSENHRLLMARTTPSLQYDGGNVKAWQGKLRQKLRQLLGTVPEERCDLRPRRLWKRDHPLGTIEKVVFTSEAQADVPAYVCLPRNVKPPYGFVICVQGHNSGMHHSIGVQKEDETKPLEVEGDRDFALQAMRRGLAALCIEQRAFGERREKKQQRRFPQICHDSAMHALMLGRTLTGERVFDVDRGIDYLASRGDADMNLIGIMGNSGGGVISMYAAAMLPRIAFSIPSCSFSRFEDSAMVIRHCPCNFIPDLFTVADMSDITGLIAPRPVVIVNGEEDDLFPIKPTREAFSDVEQIYEAAGARGRCHHVVGDGGHRFYADEAWAVMMPEIERLRMRTNEPENR